MKNIALNNLKESIAYCEALGLSTVFKSYSDYFAGEEIMEIGFNQNSGYIYIALESGIQICSQFGNDVEYVVYDDKNEEELFFNSFEKLILHLRQVVS